MTYQENIEWLYARTTTFQNVGADAYKPGLEGVGLLSEAFGNLHKRLRTLHVGGTNGKGSVSSILASVMQESGLKTGLFTSPHLLDFRERIRINGEMIPEDAVSDFLDRYRSLDLNLEPSFFELTTVMAFDWFARNNVDIAIIEVGLGGRLDSTNIIEPAICVITNISFDHTDLLGDTLEEIAREKAGIIKHGMTAVIGNADEAVAKVFCDRAREIKASIFFSQNAELFSEVIQTDEKNVYTDTPWGDIECTLTGDCQVENATTVMQTLLLMPDIDPKSVARGFKNVCDNTGLTGRWTVLAESPRVICDTGHNPGGWTFLGQRLRKIADESSRLHIVAGFVSDKDVSSIIKNMPENAEFYWTTPGVKRGRDSAEVAAIAETLGRPGRCFHSVEEAFNTALSCASPSDNIFVGGSTYVVADLLDVWKKR